MIAAIPALLLLQQAQSPTVKDLGAKPAAELKDDFNAAKNQVRLLFIWAPS